QDAEKKKNVWTKENLSDQQMEAKVQNHPPKRQGAVFWSRQMGFERRVHGFDDWRYASGSYGHTGRISWLGGWRFAWGIANYGQ
ncbi:MAG: hypothetical protein KDM63_17275, partial [Verrucomicrobiae bacterium]|nr:hypothetical protein [Verrucomicrobiae bacterium]